MFDLYREEKRIFEFADYGALLDECRRFKPRCVLEFGPGVSTLAFVEAGCTRIATCEYQERWIGVAQERFKDFPQVTLHRFVNAVDVVVHGLSRKEFDLAFVDAPLGGEARSRMLLPGQEECSRFNTLLYAIARAPVVLLHDAKRDGEQRSLDRIRQMGHTVEMIDTPKGLARIIRKPQTVPHV